MYDNPAFPSRMRNNPMPLFDLTLKWLVQTLTNCLKSESVSICDRRLHFLKQSLIRNLPFQLRTKLLSLLIPFGDAWTFGCLDGSRKPTDRCNFHPECRLVYKNCDKILRILLGTGITEVNLNLKRIHPGVYSNTLNQLNKSFSRKFESLTSLTICGGSTYSDGLISPIKRLCKNLEETAPNLAHLWLPICSNPVARHLSMMPKLSTLIIDRTTDFDGTGLWYLCRLDSRTRLNLQVCHIGIFERRNFNKIEVAEFLRRAKNLKSFSLFEENRILVKHGDKVGIGLCKKVMTYSALKLAIIDNMARGDIPFTSKLEELKVVDRSLKAKYVLRSCPNLKRLHIDWQEELSLPPFDHYSQNWFSDFIRNDKEWSDLSGKLTHLKITFPSTYESASYSLPIFDANLLFPKLINLKSLEFVGAGKDAAIPLVHILYHCRKLSEIHFEKVSIHVPDNYDVINCDYVGHNLTKFYLMSDGISLESIRVHLNKCIAAYMPNIVELAIQPEHEIGFEGLGLKHLLDLSGLKKLELLSYSLSTMDCVNNMPELIFVLRQFQCLRYLNVSWSRLYDYYDIQKARLNVMMSWLFQALKAENANIRLEWNYKLHSNMFH